MSSEFTKSPTHQLTNSKVGKYDRSYRRYAFPDSQRGDRQAHAGRHAGVAPVKTLRLFLKYGPHGEKLITGVERISRPGRRVYFGRDDVPEVLAGLGTSILTTSRGVMTGRAAVKAGVGGEVLCNIW